jgi:hypothetical protein
MNPDSRFDRLKGHWFDASFLVQEIEGDPVWENPIGVRTRDINWPPFLSGVPVPRDLQTGIALELERIDPPLMLVLPPSSNPFSKPSGERRTRRAGRRSPSSWR